MKNSGKIKLRYFGRKVSTVGKKKSKSIIKSKKHYGRHYQIIFFSPNLLTVCLEFLYTIEFIKWKLGFNGEKKPPEPDDDEEDDDLQLLLTCLLMVVIVGVFFLLCCYVMPTFFYHFWAYFGFLSSSSSGNDDSTSPKISKNGKQQNRSSNNEPETAFETEVPDGTAEVAITTTTTTETETEEEGKEEDKKKEKRKKKKRTVKKAKRLAKLPVAPVAKTPGQHRSSTETEATLQQKKRGKNLGMPHFLVNSTPLVVPISQVGAAGMMLKMLPTPVVKKSPPPPSPPLPQKKKTPTSPPQKKKAPASPPKKIAKGKRATSSIGDQLKKAKEKMRMAAPITKAVKRRLRLLNFKASAGAKTTESEDEDEVMANGSKVLMKFKSPGKGEKEGEVTQKMIILKGQQQKKEMGMIKTIKTGSPSTGPSSSSSPPASVANRRQWSPVVTSEEHHLVASVTSGILPKNSTFSTPSTDTDNTTN